MAEATERTVPKGQTRGAAGEQQEFIAETSVAEPAVPAIVPITAEPIPALVEPDAPLVDEADQPNVVGLADGDVDLDQLLLSPTDRPDEDVRFGIPGSPQVRTSISQALRGLQKRGFDTDDIRALADNAEALGL
jgi:hypothetical protein